MRFAMVHKTLAKLTENFSMTIFNRDDVRECATQALNKTGKWHQRDCPLKALFVLWFVIIMAIYRYKSMANVLMLLIMALREIAPTLSLRSVTKEAIIHARKRLGVEPLKEMFELISESITVKPTFHGLRVWAIDGVDFTLPDTPENEGAFGRPGSSRSTAAFPKMQAVALVSTTTHQIRDCCFSRYNTSEGEVSLDLIKHLGPSDLLITDRGFPSVQLLEEFSLKGLRFIVRIASHWKPRVLERLGPGDYLVAVSKKIPEGPRRGKKRRANRTITLRLRLIEYQIGDREKIRLLTNLLDPNEVSAVEIAHLYHQRWDCEISYDEIKTHLVTVKQGSLDTDFRSKKPEGILQEAYGMLIAYNLIRGLMTEAAVLHKISPLEISFVDTLQVIESSITHFEGASPRHQRFLVKRLLNDIAACRIDRPRRNRSYPRKVRVKMSNFKRKSLSDRGDRRDFKAELTMIDRYPSFSR